MDVLRDSPTIIFHYNPITGRDCCCRRYSGLPAADNSRQSRYRIPDGRCSQERWTDKLAYKYFLGLAVDEEPPDHSTLCTFRAQRLGEEKFRQVFENIVKQCIDKGLVTGNRQIIDSTHIIADITINSLTGLITLCRQNVLRDIE